MPDRPSRTVRIALAAAITLLLAACDGAPGAGGGPRRSPFDDGGPAPTAPPGVTSYPPPFTPPLLTPGPAPSPAGGASSGTPAATPAASAGTAGEAAREAAIGAAIQSLAERMAVSATRLAPVRAEAVEWPDACLGVAIPGLFCAQVITPGYRVVLRHDTGSTHEVHTGRAGALAWAPQSTIRATVQQPERANGALALADEGGRTLAVLLAPGTQRVGLAAGVLVAGDRVVLGVDDLRDGSPLRAAWITRAGP